MNTVIKSIIDPDFGPLDLVETRTKVSVLGWPKKAAVYRSWERPKEGGPGTLTIEDADGTPDAAAEVRQTFRAISGDIGALKLQAAQRSMDMAKTWANGEMMKHLESPATFVSVLELEGMSIGGGLMTVWFADTADIFAGHSLEVRIEDGEIKEVTLAG